MLRDWIEPEDVRAVFLDAGNTLVFLDFEALAAVAAELGHPVDAHRLEASEYPARRRADRAYLAGGMSDDSMFPAYFSWILEGVDFPRSRIPEAIRHIRLQHARENLWRRTRPEIGPALATLRSSGRRLAVISNSDGTCRELLGRLNLLPLLDGVYDSAEIGFEKPRPEIFQRALEDLGVRAEQTIHVGDLEAIDVAGARSASILPVLADPQWTRGRSAFPVVTDVVELTRQLVGSIEAPFRSRA